MTKTVIAVFPEFFTHYYGTNKLNSPIMIFQSCQLLNDPTKISKALLDSGARCVIGFHKYDVVAEWAANISAAITKALLEGESVQAAMDEAREDGNSDSSFGGRGAELTAYARAGESLNNFYLVEKDFDVWDGTVDTEWYNDSKDPDSYITHYVIHTAEQLAGLAKLVNEEIDDFGMRTITLAADLDLNKKEWTPIGGFDNGINVNNNFKGIFNGDDHTISNLTITGDANVAGLFGVIEHVYLDDYNVSNIKMTDVNINIATDSNVNAGSIAAVNRGRISNCTFDGNIVVIGGDFAAAGGIVGGNYTYGQVNMWAGIDGWVTDCTSNGNVSISASAYNAGAGGIVGVNGGNVTHCHKPKGKVSAYTTAPYTRAPAGGIIGYNTDHRSYGPAAVEYELSANTFHNSVAPWGIGVDVRYPDPGEQYRYFPSNDGAEPTIN